MLKAPDTPVRLWQRGMMTETPSLLLPLDGKLVDDLYCEAMLLADEARAYFERSGDPDRDALGAMDRVLFSCESLKVTTRLMHVIAWLLSRRACARGDIGAAEARDERYRLGDAAPSDLLATRAFPTDMRILIAASESLYARALRLEEQLLSDAVHSPSFGLSPAHALLQRLEAAF